MICLNHTLINYNDINLRSLKKKQCGKKHNMSKQMSWIHERTFHLNGSGGNQIGDSVKWQFCVTILDVT